MAPAKRKRTVGSSEMRRAFSAFREVVRTVEGAKDALVAAVPGGRGAGVPVAEALWAFEAGIEDARRIMERWRTAETEDMWRTCLSGLEQSLRSAEDLRLGEPPEGYEELYARLADLMAPLEVFVEAARGFRELGY